MSSIYYVALTKLNYLILSILWHIGPFKLLLGPNVYIQCQQSKFTNNKEVTSIRLICVRLLFIMYPYLSTKL